MRIFRPRPYPEVERQHQMDKAVERRAHPSWWDYVRTEEGVYRRGRSASFVEWAVACTYHSCKAPAGEPCNGANGLHAVRAEAYRVSNLARDEALRHPPEWRRALTWRTEQRRVIVALETAAYNQTLANDYLRGLRTEAEHFLIHPRMTDRAVAHGHKRAERSLRKTAERRAKWLVDRVKRAAA